MKRNGFRRCLLWAMVLVLCTGPCAAALAGVTEDRFAYTISGNEATISWYDGGKADVTLPATVEGVAVRHLDSYAFHHDETTHTVTLPEGFVSIGDCAFYECLALTSVYLPASVSRIGEMAFFNSSLRAVTLPASLKVIRENTFCYCVELSAVSIPASVTRIEAYAFGHCRSLRSLNVPASVTGIAPDAFQSCPVTLGVYPGSAALTYAIDHGIPYVLLGGQPGDANADDRVDIEDALAIIDCLVTGTQPKSIDNANADGQGGVDLADLTMVIDRILGV